MNYFEQEVIVARRCTGDFRSELSEKIKRVLKRHGVLWRNTSTHEGRITQAGFEELRRELNEVIRSHSGPGRVIQLIAKVGTRATWIDLVEPSEFEAAA